MPSYNNPLIADRWSLGIMNDNLRLLAYILQHDPALAGGVLLLGCSAALHYVLYLRLRDTGRSYIAFNLLSTVLSDYLRLRSRQGWSPWPAYFVVPTAVAGFVLLFLGAL